MKDLCVYEDDYLFDTASAHSMASLGRSLPRVVTRGPTLILEGRPQFKSPPRIPCPRCDHELQRGTTIIIFKNAPVGCRKQEVEGWVCECGETYVPGDIARAAYQAAFRESPANVTKHLLRCASAQQTSASLVLLVQHPRDDSERESAFAQLIEHHWKYILSICVRRVARQDVEDVMQEVFLKAWKNIDQCVPTQFSGWLGAIAVNMSADEVRHQQKRGEIQKRVEDNASGSASTEPPARQLESSEFIDKVKPLLTADQFYAIHARYVAEQSVMEIAAMLGRSEGAVKGLLARAKQKLRSILEAPTHEDADQIQEAFIRCFDEPLGDLESPRSFELN